MVIVVRRARGCFVATHCPSEHIDNNDGLLLELPALPTLVCIQEIGCINNIQIILI